MESDDGFLDIRGMFRAYASAYRNPDNGILSQDRTSSGMAGVARLIMEGQAGRHLGFEVNVSQTFIPAELTLNQIGQDTALDVERSGILDWSFSNDNHTHLAMDRLNIRWSRDRLDLILGRQPINLATTFYFTPNDFFGPFAAQAFYRVYKPGVDAARAEIRLGDLSQLSLISVLGYRREASSDTGWSDEADGDRTSYVGRVSTVCYDFEWALLTGVVRDTNIIGGSLQGELFQWLGVRGEGHFADPAESYLDSWSEITFGLEHHWENSLGLRLEQFYHGGGASSVSDYGTSPAVLLGESPYLGRKYIALGMSYELSPLLTTAMSAITNLVDDSCLISLNAVYSLSDETELSISLGFPTSEDPNGLIVKSEFGSYSRSFNIEVRSYF